MKQQVKHSVSIRMESGDEESHSLGREYTSDEQSISERESSADSPLEEEEEISKKIILPSIWSVNVFIVSMTKKVFSKLRPRFQILDDIPIRKAIRGEKCFTSRSPEVGLYKAAFIVGLKLPPSNLHCQLADYLGKSVCQITPGGLHRCQGVMGVTKQVNRSITLEEFFYCYKLQEIATSRGFFITLCVVRLP